MIPSIFSSLATDASSSISLFVKSGAIFTSNGKSIDAIRTILGGLQNSYTDRFIWFQLSFLKYIITNNRKVINEIKDSSIKINNRNKFLLIENGIDCDEFKPIKRQISRDRREVNNSCQDSLW